MYRVLLICIFSCAVFVSFSQQPVLVTDFNPGPEDSFDEFNYLGIGLGEKLILPIKSSDLGIELGVYDGNDLTILRDINAGSASSNPNQLTPFKDKIFFSAVDAENGGAIWATDGTPEGTVLKFAYGGIFRPTGLIVSESDHLFYTIDQKLYRTDGENVEMIFDGVTFMTYTEERSNNYTLYNGDVAFITISDNRIELYVVEGEDVVFKGRSERYSTMNNLYGLNQVEEGLIMGLDMFGGENPHDGTYIYKEGDSTITKFQIANGRARRMIDYDEQYCFAWVEGKGYYLVNGRSGEEIRLVNSPMVTMTQGYRIEHSKYGELFTFITGLENGFPNPFLYVSDGTTAGTKQLIRTGPSHTNMVSIGPYSFIAWGTDGGFTPEMWMVDATQGTASKFFQFSGRSTRLNTILIVGIVNDRLYFLSSLNQDIGRELYYFNLNLPTSTDDHLTTGPQLEVKIAADTYQLISDSYDPYNVEIYSLSGQMIESSKCIPNSIYDISHLNGIFILRFSQGNQVLSKKVFCQGKQ